MFFSDLQHIPDVMIRNWLKIHGLPRSGPVMERIEECVNTGKLTTQQVEGFIEGMKNSGRKHVYLFQLSPDSWKTITTPEVLKNRFDAFLGSQNEGVSTVFGMSLQRHWIQGSKYCLRLGKTILVPRVEREIQITHENRQWAAIVMEEVSVNVVFSVDVSQQSVEMRFDAVTDMGAEKKRIYATGANFLDKCLQLGTINSFGLSKLGAQIEKSDIASVFDVIAKVETENESGVTVTGTVRVVRDGGDMGSASELPGGKTILTSENGDILLDTYHVGWFEQKSSGKLTRNIRTQIHSLTGEVHFKHHVFEEEMEYVLSSIRKLIK